MSEQLSSGRKLVAGFFLIFFTALAAYMVIGFWPDKLPTATSKCDLYRLHMFNVRLLDSVNCTDCGATDDTAVMPVARDTTRIADTTRAADTTHPAPATAATAHKPAAKPACMRDRECCRCVINLDTLLLVLVALGGFLGNMIHIASSFTAFVGNGKYDKSWILWYFVRPFTASALALALYFAFRAGFMSYNSSGGNLNLYGVMTVAVLTGLFTDMATLKLKEIFEVIFKPKDDRGGKLTEVKVTGVTPTKLDKANPNNIVITGTGLNSKLAIKISDDVIQSPAVTEKAISFTYSVNANDQAKTEVPLVVTDENGKQVYATTLQL